MFCRDLWFLIGFASGQLFDGSMRALAENADRLFSFDRIHSFGLELRPDDIALLNTSGPLSDGSRPTVPGTFLFGGDRYAVTVKLKGQYGSFRDFSTKPGLKIKFRDRRFFGLTRLTLNNMAQDPTLVNQVVVYSLYAATGIPTPRTGYATLSVNGEDYGLYLNIETEDATFLERHFQDANGNLYEGSGWSFDLRPQDVTHWDQEEGTDTSKADLMALARTVATASADDLFFGANAPIDTPAFLSMIAVEVISGDPDAYSTAINNFRIYHEPTLDSWTFIPTGRDRAFETTLGPYAGSAFLKDRCIESNRCLSDYARRLNEVATLVHQLDLVATFDRAVDFIRVAAMNDPRTLHAPAITRLQRERVRDRLVNLPTSVPVPTQCENLTVAGHEYSYCPVPLDFARSQVRCESMGMNLVWHDTPEDMAAVDVEARRRFDRRWWIGLSNLGSPPGDPIPPYHWIVNGQAPAFTAWQPGEPNNYFGRENCAENVSVGGLSLWNDIGCEARIPSVCRR